MKKLILIFILLIPINVFAWKPDKWTIEDTILQSTSLTLLILDHYQTLQIKHHSNLHETNFILTEHPTDKKINIYFISCEVLHTTIAYILPKPYRNIFQMFTIGIETHMITINLNNGIKF